MRQDQVAGRSADQSARAKPGTTIMAQKAGEDVKAWTDRSKVEALALYPSSQNDPSVRQVDDLLFELKAALEPLRQAPKPPAPPAVAEDEDGNSIDLL